MSLNAEVIQEFTTKARVAADSSEATSYLITKFVEAHAHIYTSGLDDVEAVGTETDLQGTSDEEGLDMSSYFSGGSTRGSCECPAARCWLRCFPRAAYPSRGGQHATRVLRSNGGCGRRPHHAVS